MKSPTLISEFYIFLSRTAMQFLLILEAIVGPINLCFNFFKTHISFEFCFTEILNLIRKFRKQIYTITLLARKRTTTRNNQPIHCKRMQMIFYTKKSTSVLINQTIYENIFLVFFFVFLFFSAAEIMKWRNFLKRICIINVFAYLNNNKNGVKEKNSLNCPVTVKTNEWMSEWLKKQ